MSLLCAGLCVGAILFATVGVARADVWRSCVDAIDRAERQAQIPPGLLHAIGRLESGKWHQDSQSTVPWPWTINAEGAGQYFDSKEEAVAAVEALMARGVKLIDVGCMQVNLYYHGDVFADLEDAFDPRRNAEYASELLNSLYEETGSWDLAAGRYHSATPKFGVPYRERVMASWRQGRGVAEHDGAEPLTEAGDGQDSAEEPASDELGRRVALVPIDGERMQQILLVGQRRLLAARLNNQGTTGDHTRLLGERRRSSAQTTGVWRQGRTTQSPQRDAQSEQSFAKRRAQVLERWRASNIRTQGPVFILDDQS
ncbi:MAG: transglycosylase SLT domain-containing protein [Hyphomicrobiales bacterium]|nr:transglycosylase SLT domain-containing protein [Hyphomicrobiales bacterium]